MLIPFWWFFFDVKGREEKGEGTYFFDASKISYPKGKERKGKKRKGKEGKGKYF